VGVDKIVSNPPDMIDIDDVAADAATEERIDELLDEQLFPVENFLSELEQKLLSGESATKLRIWAKRSYGVDNAAYKRWINVIRSSWVLEGTTTFVAQQRRDELRMMYREIYRESLLGGGDDEPRNLGIALKALDSMAKLDGLTAPDVAIQINNAHPATAGELTNRTRARTQELLMLMRERAERHAAGATRAMQQIAGAKDANALQAPGPRPMGVVK
jgi:hypothetical protein